MFSNAIKEILRAVTSSLQIPTIIILLLLIMASIIMIGSVIAELFTERRQLKIKVPELIDQMQGKSRMEMDALINRSGILKRQKRVIRRLIARDHLPEGERDALARQLIFDEQNHYDRIKRITDLIARIAPMFGLMGTLIPLGPGLIALGQGDTKTLSSSLLIAFDTTVAGLISAAVSFIISAIRGRWYEEYMVGLETIMECILEEQARGAEEK